eukprot:4877177-Karenia_brevis.AAC.1
MEAIVTLPDVASSGRPSVQVSNLLLRQCVVQKAVHVLRLVEPKYTKAWAVEFDRRVMQAWCAINHSQELTESQRGLLRAPCRYGGLGFLSMEALVDAAYFAACLESAGHMRAMLPGDLRLTMPGLVEASEHLRDGCGVDAWAVSGVTLSATHEYEGTQLQRVVMRRVHDFMAVRWRRWATPLERAVADSAASRPKAPGGNDWLWARPT